MDGSATHPVSHPKPDWVYKNTDNKNEVRCNARAFSKENKANSAIFSCYCKKTNQQQFSMVL